MKDLRSALAGAVMLCDWISDSPHQRGSINGKATQVRHQLQGLMDAPTLTVWCGPMPESNGRTNWTAILHRGSLHEGFTLARSEYPGRVRYAADEVRWLLGELDKEPHILDYDGDECTPCHLCGGSGEKDGKPCWGLNFDGTVHTGDAAATGMAEQIRGSTEYVSWFPIRPAGATACAGSCCDCGKGCTASGITAMVDAAMVEMSNIHPPLRRSECERLIRAAAGVRVPDPAQLLRDLLKAEEAIRNARNEAAFEQAEVEHAIVRKAINDYAAGVRGTAPGDYERRVKELAPTLGMPLATARADMEAKDGVGIPDGGQHADMD